MTFPLFFIFYFTKYHLTFSHGPKINMRAKCNQSRCDDSSNFAQEVVLTEWPLMESTCSSCLEVVTRVSFCASYWTIVKGTKLW